MMAWTHNAAIKWCRTLEKETRLITPVLISIIFQLAHSSATRDASTNTYCQDLRLRNKNGQRSGGDICSNNIFDYDFYALMFVCKVLYDRYCVIYMGLNEYYGYDINRAHARQSSRTTTSARFLLFRRYDIKQW
jgi:hypothetical protein